MNCEVMVSTMNQASKREVIDSLKIKDCVIINQLTQNKQLEKDDATSRQKIFNRREKGLSKSRNLAISKCISDICIVADDDMYYADNYEKVIKNAYKKHPDADIIAFIVDNEKRAFTKPKFKEGKLGFIKSMKLCSVHLTFKRKSIMDKKLSFDEQFGAGSIYPWGEENIFLFDCLREGLKIYYVPEKIATLRKTETSTWDRTVNAARFRNQGAIFYRMSSKMYIPLILQYALRKRNLYAGRLSAWSVINNMLSGAKEYKKEKKNG